MRTYLLASSCLLLMAMTPVYTIHDTPDKTDSELRNIFDNAQDQAFTEVVLTTPTYLNFKDGEMKIYASTASNAMDIFILVRVGTNVYQSNNYSIIKR